MKNGKDRKDEFKRHFADIESSYDERLKALYILYPEFKPSPLSHSSNRKKKGFVSGLVKGVIVKHATLLTLDDTVKEVALADPEAAKSITRVQISNTLARFVRQGKLDRVAGASQPTFKRKGSI